MRAEVIHVSTGIVLDLHLADYGHPDGSAIIGALHRRMSKSRTDLLCGLHGQPVYLQLRPVAGDPDARIMSAIHVRGGCCVKAHRGRGMSDEHKRQTEYWAREGEAAGFRVQIETRMPGTKRQPDALIHSTVQPTAIEIQRSDLSRATAGARTRDAGHAGFCSVWASDWPHPRRAAWVDKVPSAVMVPTPWDEMPAARSVLIAHGPRLIVPVRCDRESFSRCPVTRAAPCGRFHPRLEPWRDLAVHDLAGGVPAGLIVPLRFTQGRDSKIILVSRQDKTLHDELTGTGPENSAGPVVPTSEVDPWRPIECVSAVRSETITISATETRRRLMAHADRWVKVRNDHAYFLRGDRANVYLAWNPPTETWMLEMGRRRFHHVECLSAVAHAVDLAL